MDLIGRLAPAPKTGRCMPPVRAWVICGTIDYHSVLGEQSPRRNPKPEPYHSGLRERSERAPARWWHGVHYAHYRRSGRDLIYRLDALWNVGKSRQPHTEVRLET